ncbi:ribosome silencing factor [Chlamydia sp. 17-3921]|uniref:ribosome silencing factor n=1 Tax=Chlamydia sp. 17-3921 TaxID=2675798 RepID=UPI0019189D3D|nr:ribosome silencing factor [Chlamydia sp. 17-3921]
MELFYINLLKTIAKVINQKKGNNLIVLDVSNISDFTNYFVFAEGNVCIHVKALANEVIHVLKKQNLLPHVEGMNHGDWIVIDYGYIVIHLFISAIRERYRLEELWKDGSNIALNF